MRTIDLPGGGSVPALGQGTWMVGDNPARREREIEALRTGLDLGLTLVDTAEIYGDGDSERLVAAAIAGRRDEVFVVSKVAPSNASRDGTLHACEASLDRLGIRRIDLYLLHWRGRHPLADTVAAFAELQAVGRIRHWGVSNFDVADMEELWAVPGGSACAANQILYNPQARGPEFDLLPWLRDRGVAAMAYSPVGQGGDLLGAPALAAIGLRHGGASPAQVALAFALRHEGVVAIPKAASAAHVRDNAAALSLALSEEDMREIDHDFPPPRRKASLEMI